MSHWPQYTWIILALIGTGINLSRFGKPKTDKYDFTDLVVGPAIIVTILYYGGFFTPIGWGP